MYHAYRKPLPCNQLLKRNKFRIRLTLSNKISKNKNLIKEKVYWIMNNKPNQYTIILTILYVKLLT